MTDICMCKNENCAIRESCYRYRADPGEWQAYFIVDKEVKDESDCDEYWKVVSDKQIHSLNMVWRD